MTAANDRKPTAFPTSVWAYMILTVMLMSFFPAKTHASTPSTAAFSIPSAELILAQSQPRADPASPVRVYGNSVIPGGVSGSLELASALGRDKIVSDHFVDFDAANARVVYLEQAKLVYVSYQLGNNIYWTKNKVRLAKGEALLTDGKSFVRARCGNRIADDPQLMVSNMEPAPEVLDTAKVMPSNALSLVSDAPGSIGPGAATASGASDNARKITAPVSALTAPQQLATTVSGSTAPRTDNLAVLKSGSDLTTSPLPQENAKPAGAVLANFPSGLSDLESSPSGLLADETATELPEPGSLALLMLTLIFMALVRLRDPRKVR